MNATFTADPQDPQAILDYEIDWTPWLATGETVENDATAVSNEPASFIVSNVSVVSNKVRFRAGGGSHGTDYFVTVHVTTSTGQEDERTLRIPVRER